MTQRVLTGITTTGTPHLGNYVGAIRPAIAASRRPDTESFFFLADYHALIKCDDPTRVERSRMALAATWLAAGLDPERVVFYRQSDVPEITELTWLLTCVTAKGLMNRAHAYKAATDQNESTGEDPDLGVNMGLYSYPILMAADILMFNANKVPVGRDQIQHIEMTRDIAQRFNHLFGRGKELFVLPEVVIDQRLELLPGLDGRKMSKSYDNVIPLFEGGVRGLKDAIARVVTDSRLPGEPKDPDSTALSTLFDAFADDDAARDFRDELRKGLGWGDAKQRLFERVDAEIGPMRARYDELMAKPGQIEDIMQQGAARARKLAAPFLAQLREAVGLRPFHTAAASQARQTVKQAPPQFKQYREADGRFYFKLTAHDGRILLQSQGFNEGREAGQWIGRLKREGEPALAEAPVEPGSDVSPEEIAAALNSIANAS